jgi:hypothetical protein
MSSEEVQALIDKTMQEQKPCQIKVWSHTDKFALSRMWGSLKLPFGTSWNLMGDIDRCEIWLVPYVDGLRPNAGQLLRYSP